VIDEVKEEVEEAAIADNESEWGDGPLFSDDEE
jgi:hypothetical protein